MVTRPHHLAEHVDTERIVRAIEDAERSTSAHVMVVLASHLRGSIRAAAEKAFAAFGVDKNPHRNGVLIFVVPSRREFVILGDATAHDRAGQHFWERLAAALSQRIGADGLTAGLAATVEDAGRELTRLFPSGAPAEG